MPNTTSFSLSPVPGSELTSGSELHHSCIEQLSTDGESDGWQEQPEPLLASGKVPVSLIQRVQDPGSSSEEVPGKLRGVGRDLGAQSQPFLFPRLSLLLRA